MRRLGVPALVWLLACCLARPAVAAAGARPLDVVLLLDVSASMLTSDPQNHRQEAIRGFMALLNEQDRLAVLTFGDQVRRISGFVPMDAEQRLRLEAQLLPQMTAQAAYTNLLAALEQGLRELEARRAEAQVLVVLFTDGRMDMGNLEVNERLTRDLKERVLPGFRSSGARIYGVAFSEGSDQGLLEEMARHTSGFTHSARRPEDVWRAFGDLFEIMKKPDRLPVSNGRFVVDGSVREFKVLSGEHGITPVSLRSPSGKNTVNTAADSANPVVTIRNPEVGEWTIANASGSDKVVAASSLALATDLPDYVSVGRLPLAFKTWIEHEHEPDAGSTANANQMELVMTEAGNAPRRVIPLRDTGSGVFSGQLPVLPTGVYQLELEATGSDFRRSKHLTLTVVPAAQAPDVMPSPPPAAPSANPALPPPTPRPASGMVRFDDPAAWKALKVVIWANLVVLVCAAAAFLWHRRRHEGE